MRPANSKFKNLAALWKQFLPLSLSDVTMAFGDPAITATLAHMPNARVNLAAVGVAKSLAVFFESPIIMLLHASNALAISEKARAALWRFTLIAMAVLTGSLLILAFPPVFEIVAGRLLGVPPELSGQARTVLLLLFLWPAAIAWRRFYQGLLIRSGNGAAVARASLARLGFVLTLLAAGYAMGISGVWLAGLALIGGVITEAGVVTLSSKRHIVEKAIESKEVPLPSNVRGIWKFYWPLANSMIVVWGGRALLVGVIARAADAPIALAAWPAAWGLVLLVANSTRMVQQVIIRNKHEIERRALFEFAFSVGLVASVGILLLGLTPWGRSAVSAFVGYDELLFSRVIPVILLCSLVPMLVALQNAVQGFLIGDGKTHRVNVATWVGTTVLLGSSGIAVAIGTNGATAAALAMLLGLVCETVVLTFGIRNRAAVAARRNLWNEKGEELCRSLTRA